MKPTYTLREAADLLGRSERFIWNHVQKGAIRAEKAGKSLVLDAESVLAFARAAQLRVRGDDDRARDLPPPPPPPRSAGAARDQPTRFTFRELGAYATLRRHAGLALAFLAESPAATIGHPTERAAAALIDALEALAVG